MSKYIDLEKLIAEIRHIVEEETPISKGADYYHGVADTADKLISFITSLQQEHPDDLDADIEMEWDSFNKYLDESGEESEDVVWLNWNNFYDVARYFYELGLKAK